MSSRREALLRAQMASKDGGRLPHIRLPDGVTFFKVESVGPYRLDILGYKVTVNNNPVFKPGETSPYREYFLHSNVGPSQVAVVCPNKTWGKPCPICEEHARLNRQSGVDKEVLAALRPKQRRLYNVVNAQTLKGVADATNAPVHVYDVSYHLVSKAMDEWYDSKPECEDFDSPGKKGCSLMLKFEQKSYQANKFYQITRVDEKSRDHKYTAEIVSRLVDLDTILVERKYDEIQKLFATGEADGNTEDPDVSAVPTSSADDDDDAWLDTAVAPAAAAAAKAKAKTPAPEADDDEDNDFEAPPKAAAKPAKAKPAKAKPAAPEVDDDDDFEATVAKTAAKANSAAVDDEDDIDGGVAAKVKPAKTKAAKAKAAPPPVEDDGDEVDAPESDDEEDDEAW